MASDAKACFSSKVEYRAVIRYLYLKGKTGELADVYGSSAPSYVQVKFWVGEFNCGRRSLEDEARGGGRVVRRCRVSYVTGASNLILAYSWTRPAILVAGKGRGGMFLFLLFLHYHPCSSFFSVPLFHLLYYLFYIFSPFLWETTQNDPQGLMCR